MDGSADATGLEQKEKLSRVHGIGEHAATFAAPSGRASGKNLCSRVYPLISILSPIP